MPPDHVSDEPLGHMRQLDGLRAVAVGLVVYAHYLHPWVSGFPVGHAGVLLFFVLSGFLITGILLRCRDYMRDGEQSLRLTLRQFYVRRFLRIFPLFYGALLVAVVLGISPVARTLPWHLLYLSNIYLARRGDYHGVVSHFWSLAVEEQFYLVWPCCVLLVSARAFPRLVTALVAATPAFRAVALGLGASILTIRMLMPGYMDALGLGALLAVLSRRDSRDVTRRIVRSRWTGLLAVGVAAAVLYGTETVTSAIWRDTALSLTAFWIVGRAAEGFTGLAGRLLASAPMVALGRVSYGIYVIHPFTPKLLGKIGLRLEPGEVLLRAIPIAVVLTAATVGLALLSWRYYEGPLNARKRRYPYRVRAVPKGAAGVSPASTSAALADPEIGHSAGGAVPG